MNWREWLNNRPPRERRLFIAGAVILIVALVRFLVISPFLAYRADLRDDIEANRAMLENASGYLAHAGDTAKQRETLQARYRQLRGQLVPGDTPTLAAAALQDTLRSLANEKGIDIQSTQVMRDETIGDFKRIAVRITVTGELKALAEFLNGIEHGPVRVSLPFLEISRRGAALRGKGARTLATTLEVSAFLQGSPSTDGTAPAASASPSKTAVTPQPQAGRARPEGAA
jgi:Tfp pilus assembly protein PilO